VFLSGIRLEIKKDIHDDHRLPTGRNEARKEDIMKNVHIEYRGGPLDFQHASLMAREIALKEMQQPTIVSWHQDSNQHMSPYYDGANPDSWWEKYGAGNGGELEVSVGDEYEFVMMDAKDYETLGRMPLRNLSDAGNEYLCYTPILGMVTNKPNPEACTELDGWLADQL
jgi:hypothetical protein